jgi:tRNA (guanosine-2'-O-)-methyltransferase
LKNKGYQIIATTPHDDDCVMEDFDISKPSALFFGTERDGLSEEILQRADGFLKIDGRFYREFEYLCVCSHHYSEPNE